MIQVSFDVIVIGSGAAGLRAAISVRSAGLSVCVVSKGNPGKSTCTGFSAGVMAGSAGKKKSDTHLQRTLTSGRGLNERELVEILVAEAPSRLDELMRWGIHADFKNGYLYAKGRPPVLGEEIIRCLLIRNEALGTRFWGNLLVTDVLVCSGAAGLSAYEKSSCGTPMGVELKDRLRKIMWEDGGIIREEKGLARALGAVKDIQYEASTSSLKSKLNGKELLDLIELRSAARVATLILEAALMRRESRGSHFREDFPSQNDVQWQGHLQVHLAPGGENVWQFEPITKGGGSMVAGPIEPARPLIEKRGQH